MNFSAIQCKFNSCLNNCIYRQRYYKIILLFQIRWGLSLILGILKKVIKFNTTKISFSKCVWTIFSWIFIHQLSVLPLIFDLMENSSHVHVHVQTQSTKTKRKHMRSSELSCSFFKIFSVGLSYNDWFTGSQKPPLLHVLQIAVWSDED